GKFFHIFQRPVQLGVVFYKQVGRTGPQASCGRCGEPFVSQMQVEDLKQVLAEWEFDYRLDGPSWDPGDCGVCCRIDGEVPTDGSIRQERIPQCNRMHSILKGSFPKSKLSSATSTT